MIGTDGMASMVYFGMKSQLLAIVLWVGAGFAQAAAPDDIEHNDNQRAWYDATDIDADGNYTDNPSRGSSIGLWQDKSGHNNDISNTSSRRPFYETASPASGRNGVSFDGNNDSLRRIDGDIWSGPVNHSEIFVMATTDKRKQSFIFSSMKTHDHRLASHIPWSDRNTYFDHGQCCGSPARLNSIIPITFSQHYIWHYIADGNSQQSVVQDGVIQLNDTDGVGTYTPDTYSDFALAARSYDGAQNHDGKIYEAIFYQTSLNTAQRRIMSTYLSAKWDKALASGATYADVYSGDDAAHGDYDFFVGGIGKESDGSQTTGTSQGLTILNNNFLTADNKYVVAGVDYLTTSPPVGTTTVDLPTGYRYRAQRTWYIDTTGSGGTVYLDFDAASLGLPVDNGALYGLMHRSVTGGSFAHVATANMTGGTVRFDLLPSDGVYTIGKIMLPILHKTSCVISDPVNASIHPKRIPGARIRYAIEVNNTSAIQLDNVIVKDSLSTVFDIATIAQLHIGNTACNCTQPGVTNPNGSQGTGNGVNPVKLDFGTVNANTKACGYFEVDIE
jgi:hypothetical protein